MTTDAERAALLVMVAVLDNSGGDDLAWHATHEVVYSAGATAVMVGLAGIIANTLIAQHGGREGAADHCRALLAQTYSVAS